MLWKDRNQCRISCNLFNAIKVYEIDVCSSYQKNKQEESVNILENLREVNVIAKLLVGGDEADPQGHQAVAHGQEGKSYLLLIVK